MSLKLAISDTCFIIDWSYYRKRRILNELFQTVLLPEQVLEEVEDEKVISWISKNLASGKMLLFTPSPLDLRRAEELMLEVASRPYMRKIEIPEALCLVVGFRLNAVVLTENRGALLVPRMIKEWERVKVWRALETIKEAIKRGYVRVSNEEDIKRVFEEYERDTRHIFPRRDLIKAIEEVLSCLRIG